MKSEAYSAWNNYLSKVEITTTDKDEKTKFYTALYHTAISPNLCTDTDGRYLGMDLKVHQGRVEEPVYTNFSLWNTFRALHPLLSIIAPKLNNQFINSLLLKNREGGILPMWDLASNYTGTMIGYHAVSLLADAYVKGYADFDLDEAYGACLRAAEYDTTGIQCPSSVLPCLMPMSKYYKNKIGYIPCDRENESVAKALEYAYDDFAFLFWLKQIVISEIMKNITDMRKLINSTSILLPDLCVDWIQKENGIPLSILDFRITVMMTIVKGQLGNGLGLCLMI